MRIERLLALIFIIFTAVGGSSNINWQSWSNEIFKKAAKENKLILLNLEAVWCHWCHVMERETYSNAEVAQKLNQSFIAVKVDQDSYPELSLRYREYGWPATIIFNSKGDELEKLSGYIEAKDFLKTLNKVKENPVPKITKPPLDPKFELTTSLDAKYKEDLIKRHYNSLDYEKGGLKTVHRFLDAETLEYSFLKAWIGEKKDAEFIQTTLSANLKLFDPVWGGVYQYSTKRGWENPHYEKIIQSQADNLRLYSFAYSLWGEERDWKAATDVYRYIKSFLTSPDGAFYTSQDADLVKGRHSKEYFSLSDSERRSRGIPAIDKNIYARENGWVISALAAFYAATGNQTMLDDAIKAAEWILKHRALNDGGFKHGENDTGGPFLGDSLSMGTAFLDLYAKTGERRWLSKAEDAAGFIIKNFQYQNSAPGYLSSKHDPGSILPPYKDLYENIQVTRFLKLLYHYTGKESFKKEAGYAMQYVASPAAGNDYINNSGVLIADYEYNSEPLHITVVGAKDDPVAKELFLTGQKYFATFKRTEWWDKSEGPMPNPDVEYPSMPKAAAFICTNKRCSLPIFKAEKISETIKLLYKPN